MLIGTDEIAEGRSPEWSWRMCGVAQIASIPSACAW
jgi:hypothetical protein